MVDFKALKSMTSADIAASEASRQEEFYQADETERDRKSKTRIALTLVREPEFRSTISGERTVLFYGTQDKQTAPSVAEYKIPERVMGDRDAENNFMRQMEKIGGGDRLSLAGQWSQRHWKDREGTPRMTWEFKAQHMAEGEVSLEKMLARSKDGKDQSADLAAKAAMAARGAGMGS